MKKENEAITHIRQALSIIPDNIPVAVIMRHAERGEMTKGHHGNDILLTPKGEKDAFYVGEIMRGRIANLLHSPVPRCQKTASCMQDGDGARIPLSEWLGLRCDVFVEDFEMAVESTLKRLVCEESFYDVFVDQMSTVGMGIPYPYFKPPLLGVAHMVKHTLNQTPEGLSIGITHDWLVNVAASYITGNPTRRENYADFLDAVFVWEEAGKWMMYYKGITGTCNESFVKTLIDI